MKTFTVFFVFLVLICLSNSLYAETGEDLACEMVLCLYGEKTGFGGEVECDPAMAQYKKIMKKSKWGNKILCQQTKELRVAEMSACDQDYDLWSLVDCDE